MKRLFVDMDGTLAEFRRIRTMETLYEPGYFLSLHPYANVVKAVQKIRRSVPSVEVYILSAVLPDSRYALCEKKRWLDKWMPGLDVRHRIFVRCGDDKAACLPAASAEDYLLDDYTENLMRWVPPAHGIKLLNDLNGRGGSWRYSRLRYDKPPDALVSDLKKILFHGSLIRDPARCRVEVYR